MLTSDTQNQAKLLSLMENENYSQRAAVAAAKAARELSNPEPQSEISELEDSDTKSVSTLPEVDLNQLTFKE